MKTYTEFLTGGIAMKLSIGGSIFYMQKADQGPTVTVEFFRGNSVIATLDDVGKGFKAKPEGGFDAVRFKAATDGTLVFVIAEGDVNFQYDTDKSIIGNDDAEAVPVRVPAGQRIPVDIGGGTVEVTATNVGINNDEAHAIPVKVQKAATVVNTAPVNATDVAAVLLAANAARRGARMRNLGPNTAALVGAGGTFANAAVLINPGETWNEDEAAGAAWYIICAAGETATINIQEIQ